MGKRRPTDSEDLIGDGCEEHYHYENYRKKAKSFPVNGIPPARNIPSNGLVAMQGSTYPIARRAREVIGFAYFDHEIAYLRLVRHV